MSDLGISGMRPMPWRTIATSSGRSFLYGTSAGPCPPLAPTPWHDSHTRANTALPESLSSVAIAASDVADASKNAKLRSKNWELRIRIRILNSQFRILNFQAVASYCHATRKASWPWREMLAADGWPKRAVVAALVALNCVT